jgi:uncharacterized membrane protein YgcG
MARWWARGILVIFSAASPVAGIAALAEGCGSHTVVSGDGGNDGKTDAPDAGETTTVLHPDAAPLPGQKACEVTVVENIPVAGAVHVPVCTHVDYATNPPSGGDHWGVWAAFKSYDVPVPREMYVHDEEHGALVLLHNCEGPCPDVVEALNDARQQVTGDPLCLMIPGGPTERVVITPDPLLDVPLAAAAWGATYRATCIDPPSLQAFAKKHYGHGPETLCGQGWFYGDDGGTLLCGDGGDDAAGGAGGSGGAAGGAGSGGAGGSGGSGGTGGI